MIREMHSIHVNACYARLDCKFFSSEPIVVEYEFPEYTTSETIGFVELCAVVTSHPHGTPRPFVISATTADGSASMYAS